MGLAVWGGKDEVTVVPISAKTRGWVEFQLAAPVRLTAGEPGLWLVLRRTRGELFWLAAGAGDVRCSTDQGQTWTDKQTLRPAAAATNWPRPDIAAEWFSDAGVGAYPPLFIGKLAHTMRI